MAQPELRLLPVAPRDQGLIRHWLRDPGVQAWWGNAAAAEAEVAVVLASDGALARMIHLGDEPIGYAHAVDSASLDGPLPVAIQPGTFDCDLFIGVAAHRGQGHGQRALDLLALEVFGTTLALACSVVVSIRNERAVRAYERVGFVWKSVWQDPIAGPSWVMVRQRPAV
ncbi:MAG: GNAT family N-acetyltransferase [Hyphomicrobiaceae bacterium]